jgi:hypothetical protein
VSDSLVTGKITGKIKKYGPYRAPTHGDSANISIGSGYIPCIQEQGSYLKDQGNKALEQGNDGAPI